MKEMFQMFDILTDIWSHPGAIHAPILPFDITDLKAEDAEERISLLHKFGYDSLLVYCDRDAFIEDRTVLAVLAAAAKRFMPVFFDDSVVTASTSCTDRAFTEYNTMLASHKLTLVKAPTELTTFSEEIISVYVKISDGKLIDVRADLKDVEDTDAYDKYTFVMESTDGIDLLCPETTEMLLYGAYETFLSCCKEYTPATLVGIFSNRLMSYNTDTVFWTYDMLSEFFSAGGDLKMLVSIFLGGDKRSEKEGRRLYNKTLSARLEETYCRPLSEWCGRASLAFAGEAPLRFASNCGRRFTLPVWSREGYVDNSESVHDIISGVRFLGDMARGEGFTGSAYKAVSADADVLIRELDAVWAASCALVILPEKFADTEYLGSIGVRREDMKKLCTRIKRYSTLGTSCGSKTSVAVICDDDFVPYQGAEKLRTMGADFNFVSKAQIMERGRADGGELLIDKFRYTTLLIDQRVRLEPSEVKKIGESVSYGGTMYRGGAFGDFAKKNIEISPLIKEAAASLIVYETEKCSCPVKVFVNISDSTVKLNAPAVEGLCCVLDAVNGKKRAVGTNETLRLLPYSVTVLMYDPEGKCEEIREDILSEVIALREGNNSFDIGTAEGVRAVIELDRIDGHYVDIEVNGKSVSRILCPAYTADITSWVKSERNIVTLSSDGGFFGAALRIFSAEI